MSKTAKPGIKGRDLTRAVSGIPAVNPTFETRSCFILTPTERNVLRLHRSGLTVAQIAVSLGVGRSTVWHRLDEGMGKIKAHNDLEETQNKHGFTSLSKSHGHARMEGTR